MSSDRWACVLLLGLATLLALVSPVCTLPWGCHVFVGSLLGSLGWSGFRWLPLGFGLGCLFWGSPFLTPGCLWLAVGLFVPGGGRAPRASRRHGVVSCGRCLLLARALLAAGAAAFAAPTSLRCPVGGSSDQSSHTLTLNSLCVFWQSVYDCVLYIYMISSLTRICSVHSSWIEKNWLLITVIVYRSIAVLTSCLCEKTCDVFCASLLHQPTIGCFPCSVSSMFDQRMDDQNRGMFHHLKVIDKCFFWLFFFLYPFCIRSDSVVLFTRVRFVSQHTSILK